VEGREEDGVEEKKENRPSKGGDPKSVVIPSSSVREIT